MSAAEHSNREAGALIPLLEGVSELEGEYWIEGVSVPEGDSCRLLSI